MSRLQNHLHFLHRPLGQLLDKGQSVLWGSGTPATVLPRLLQRSAAATTTLGRTSYGYLAYLGSQVRVNLILRPATRHFGEFLRPVAKTVAAATQEIQLATSVVG